MNVGGENVMEDLKLKEKDLFPVSLKVKVADNRKTEVFGGAFVGIKAADVQNKETTTKELIYFVKGVKGLFLSKSCCRKLRIIAKNFPVINVHETNEISVLEANEKRNSQVVVEDETTHIT